MALVSYRSKFTSLSHILIETKESADSWGKIRDSLEALRKLFTSEITGREEFHRDLDKIVDSVLVHIDSKRTTLSKAAVELAAHLAEVMESNFRAYTDRFAPALANCLRKSEALTRNRGHEALSKMINHVGSLNLIPHICEASLSKSIIARPFGAALLKELVEVYPAEKLLSSHKTLEDTLTKALAEPELKIKEVNRKTFGAYILKLPSREAALLQRIPKEHIKFFRPAESTAKAQATQAPSRVPAALSRSSSISSAGSKTPKLITQKPLDYSGVQPRYLKGISSAKPVTSALKKKPIVNHKLPDLSNVTSRINSGRPNPTKAPTSSSAPSILKPQNLAPGRPQASACKDSTLTSTSITQRDNPSLASRAPQMQLSRPRPTQSTNATRTPPASSKPSVLKPQSLTLGHSPASSSKASTLPSTNNPLKRGASSAFRTEHLPGSRQAPKKPAGCSKPTSKPLSCTPDSRLQTSQEHTQTSSSKALALPSTNITHNDGLLTRPPPMTVASGNGTAPTVLPCHPLAPEPRSPQTLTEEPTPKAPNHNDSSHDNDQADSPKHGNLNCGPVPNEARPPSETRLHATTARQARSPPPSPRSARYYFLKHRGSTNNRSHALTAAIQRAHAIDQPFPNRSPTVNEPLLSNSKDPAPRDSCSPKRALPSCEDRSPKPLKLDENSPGARPVSPINVWKTTIPPPSLKDHTV